MVGNSSRKEKLRLQAYVPRTSLSLTQLARPCQLNLMLFLCRGAQIWFSGYGDPAFPSWFSTTFLKIIIEIMTLELLQVCKLWIWVYKGMLHLKHFATKVLMAINPISILDGGNKLIITNLMIMHNCQICKI